MQPTRAETFLEAAERHVVEGEQRITRLLRLLRVLEESGADVSRAREALRLSEETLASMYRDLELARRKAYDREPTRDW